MNRETERVVTAVSAGKNLTHPARRETKLFREIFMSEEKQFYTEPEYWESLVTSSGDYPYPRYLAMLQAQKKRDLEEFRGICNIEMEDRGDLAARFILNKIDSKIKEL